MSTRTRIPTPCSGRRRRRRWRQVERTYCSHDSARPDPTGVHGYLGLRSAHARRRGHPSTYGRGAQVDHVKEIEVVTGGRGRPGALLSRQHHPDLFEAVLAGLGSAASSLGQARSCAALRSLRIYQINYTSNAAFFRRRLQGHQSRRGRRRLPAVLPDGVALDFYQMNLGKFWNTGGSPPDDAAAVAGLSVPPSAAVVQDVPFVPTHSASTAPRILQAIGPVGRRAAPWFDVFLPAPGSSKIRGHRHPLAGADDTSA